MAKTQKLTFRRPQEARLAPGVHPGSSSPVPGTFMTMAGLPKRPAAETIDIDDKGQAVGLF